MLIAYFIEYKDKYMFLPFVLFVILIINVMRNSWVKSFYFDGNIMILCKDKKEHSIDFYSISDLEILTDLDSIFGIKKVLIHLSDSRKVYSISLVNEKAKKLIFWIQAKISEPETKLFDDLLEFWED